MFGQKLRKRNRDLETDNRVLRTQLAIIREQLHEERMKNLSAGQQIIEQTIKEHEDLNQ